jgi:hypothetical protein
MAFGSGLVNSSKVWLRWYMRYSAGFEWGQSNPPHYAKEMYWQPSNGAIFDWSNGRFCVALFWASGCGTPVDTQASVDFEWKDLWDNPAIPGIQSDGSWHCFEGHLDMPGGVAKIWIDDTLVLDVKNSPVTGKANFQVVHTSNQNTVMNGAHYTDFDDIAISQTQRIGCLGSSGGTGGTTPSAPTNLRITE